MPSTLLLLRTLSRPRVSITPRMATATFAGAGCRVRVAVLPPLLLTAPCCAALNLLESCRSDRLRLGLDCRLCWLPLPPCCWPVEMYSRMAARAAVAGLDRGPCKGGQQHVKLHTAPHRAARGGNKLHLTCASHCNQSLFSCSERGFSLLDAACQPYAPASCLAAG
jgi:hypothetical protein